jgi:hypothetical protein
VDYCSAPSAGRPSPTKVSPPIPPVVEEIASLAVLAWISVRQTCTDQMVSGPCADHTQRIPVVENFIQRMRMRCLNEGCDVETAVGDRWRHAKQECPMSM